MSSCIKDLCDYEIIKKYSKCGIFSFKSNFYRDMKKNDGLSTHFKICRKTFGKNYYNEHYDLENNRQRR